MVQKQKSRGRNPKWVTVSQDSRKRRKQRAAREEERKEKLRVHVDGGQLTIHWIKMFTNGRKGDVKYFTATQIGRKITQWLYVSSCVT